MTIDTSAIEGFDAMTPEQKVEALLKVDVPEKVDLSMYVPKKTFDDTASDLATVKRQLRERMTTDEQAAKDAAEAQKKLQDDYNALLKESTIADHTARYLALGYEEKLARATAEALFDGDMDKVFANQQAHNAEMEKKLRAEIMKDTPRPNGAGGGGGQKSEDVDFARQLAARKAASRKESDEVLKHYL